MVVHPERRKARLISEIRNHAMPTSSGELDVGVHGEDGSLVAAVRQSRWSAHLQVGLDSAKDRFAVLMLGMPIGPAVEVSSGVSRLTIRSHIVVGTRKENPTGMFVSDEPPLTATAL